MAVFTADELRVIAFNLAGRSTEIQTHSAYKLSWAGGNSGLSIGILQWDFGGRSAYTAAATDLISGYNSWAATGQQLTSQEQASLSAALVAKGSTAGNFLTNNPALVEKINAFLISQPGQAYVAGLDEISFTGTKYSTLNPYPINGLQPFADKVTNTATISGMSESDARMAMTLAMATYNKSPANGNKVLTYISGGTRSVEDIKTYIKDQIGSAYYDHVMRGYAGAELLNTVLSSNSTFAQALKAQLAKDPSLVSDFQNQPFAQILDGMFRNPSAGTRFLQAAEAKNSGALIQISSLAPNETRFVGVTTTGDLFVLDKNGVGQRQINGEWYPTVNGDESGIGILIRPEVFTSGKNKGKINPGKWIIALADGTELTMAEGDNPELSLGSQSVALNDGGYLFVNGQLQPISVAQAQASYLAGLIKGTGGNLENLDRDLAAQLIINMATPIVVAGNGDTVIDPLLLNENAEFHALYEAVLGDPNLQIAAASDGSGYAIFSGGQTYTLTGSGQLSKVVVNSESGQLALEFMTGKQAGTTLTVAINGQLSEEQTAQLGSLLTMSLASTGEPVAIPSIPLDEFNGTIVGTITRTGTGEVLGTHTVSPVTDVFGTRIGTKIVTVNTNGASSITTESINYLDQQRVTEKYVTVTATSGSDSVSVRAAYFDDQFAGITHLNGVTVSPGLSTQIGNMLAAQGITNPTAQDLNSALSFTENDPELTPEAQRIQAVLTAAQQDMVVVTDDFGKPTYATQVEASMIHMGHAVNTVTDAFSLINAIQSGKPLPIVASGLRLAVDFDRLANGGAVTPELGAAAGIAGSLLSLYNLSEQLKNGDTLGAVQSAGYAVYGAYEAAKFLETSGAIDAVPEALGSVGEALGEALPYVSIIANIANGNYVGAAVGVAVALFNIPYIGWIYAIYTAIKSIFSDDDPPKAWGGGHYEWSDNGVTVVAAGENGGAEQITSAMSSFLNTLQNIADKSNADNPDFAFGIIPNRLPTLQWLDYQHPDAGWRMVDIDYTTGAERAPGIRYDNTWNPVNAESGSPYQFMDLGTRFIYSAVERGAIAPWWEVQTARIQTAIGDPRAGLTEEERAARDGKMAAPLSIAPEATQTFRPVALDLSGDGRINIIDKTTGVSFNVDDSGYFKQTGWVAPQDGFLFLDRNFNGVVDQGKELFNNGAIDISARGLKALQWIDADQDGDLDASDPVFSQLKIWQDANSNGQEDTISVNGVITGHPELKSLSELGITRLNYRTGTYEQNGQLKLMASPDITADAQGQTVVPIKGGLLVRTSDGQTSIIVTQISASTRLDAGADQIDDMYEDVTVLISPGDLLANDTVGGLEGSDPYNGLQITSVFNARHGSVSIDPNGFIRFVPEADYSGPDAGFEYQVKAPTGQTTTTFVDITLQNLNDAPSAVIDQHLGYIYGYASQTPVWNETIFNLEYVPADPQYAPYYGFDAVSGTTGWHTTPLSSFDSDGEHTGSLIVTDKDDASGFTYEIVGKPAFGDATVDANGNWHYINWAAPNQPGEHWSSIPIGDTGQSSNYDSTGYDGKPDAFLIKVMDPHGASTTVQVDVHHTGEYYPDYGTGGGGKKPIAIDLDGNGFGFTDIDDSNVFVDINKDGWRHRMAWVNPGDGLLAFDANGNGKIDSATEFSFAAYKQGAQTDLEGLQAFDSNGDGKFSAADDKWASFGVWRDANQNGATDTGEFLSLDEVGIESVSLASDGQFRVINGQTVHGIGSVTMEDGSARQLADVTLKYSDDVLLSLPDGSTKVINKPANHAGAEQIDGTDNNDLLLGTSGNTIIYGQAGDDIIFDDGGNDLIDTGSGNDQVYSGGDSDVIMAGEGDDTVYAGLGNDLLLGGDGDDVLMAEGGNDVVFGGAGKDFIAGGTGNDVLSGDQGNDRLFGEQGRDALFGGDGDDQLFGLDDDDLLDGGQGNDLLDGGAGADVMTGGDGNDAYVIDNANDTITELASEGVDSVTAFIDYTLGENLENLTLADTAINGTGNATDNKLSGNGNNNRLVGNAGNDTLDGGAGADTLIGGFGNDTYVVDNVHDDVIEAENEGIDTVRATVDYTLAANVENLVLTGTAAINGTGNADDNELTGNSGDNILDGRAGADRMVGGRGNDVYYVNQAGDQVIEATGEGRDTVISSLAATTLVVNVETLILDDSIGTQAQTGIGNALDNVLIGNGLDNTLDGGAGADIMAGGAGNDQYRVDQAGDIVIETAGNGVDSVIASVDYTLSANVENLTLTGTAVSATGNELANVLAGTDVGNVLSGLAGDDTLFGGAGDDYLDGGTGGDVMQGASGNDIYFADNAADAIVENTDEGTDQVLASVSYTLSANVENLTLTGSADLTATGNSLANVLTANSGSSILQGLDGNDQLIGGAGNDWLDGGGGIDTMQGGAGNDTYLVDHADDAVIERANDGIDSVLSSVSYTLSANVENLALTGDHVLTGTGNDLDNTLVANDAGSALFGLAGNDTLRGGTGADYLDGGTGVDWMQGGAGDDTYIVDTSADQVAENNGDGIDLVIASADFALTSHVENLTLTGHAIQATGNELANTLIGNSQANIIDGGAGVDWMQGGAGDDIYIVDDSSDKVIEQDGEGTDTVRASASYTLGAAVENLVLTSDGAVTGTGNAHANILTANDAGNALYGMAGDDQLLGGAGNDFLDGGTGADTMQGGSGDDTYMVDAVGDIATEFFNAGYDTVRSSINYVLPDQIERLILTGDARTGIGNLLDNTLLGNDLDNYLDGGAGEDLMAGGKGNDIYMVDNTGDAIMENANEGVDSVFASASYTLSANVDNLTLTGSADLSGTGNELANVLTANDGNSALFGMAGDDQLIGGGGNNLLDGGSGADVMRGGKGDDTYIVDLQIDTVVEAAGEGLDSVLASVSFSLSDNVENLTLTGTADLAGTGNALDNVVIGNSGANALAGLAGNDTLRGGAGHDMLVGGTGNDLLAGGEGDDTYWYYQGDDLDRVADTAGQDTVRFGAGLTLDNLALRLVDVNGQKIAQIRVLDGNGDEQPDQGIDFAVTTDANGQVVSPIEQFFLGDGQQVSFDDLLIKQTTIYGTNKADNLLGDRNDNTVYGDNNNDIIRSGTGHDIIYGGNGADILYGGGGNDQLYGGNQADTLYGEGGNDLLDGGNDDDLLIDTLGNNVFYGGNGSDYILAGAGNDQINGDGAKDNGVDVVQAGAGNDMIATGNGNDLVDAGTGNDSIDAGSGNDWIAAGKGNDVIHAGQGNNIMAFNRGDGQDTVVTSSSGGDAISLGGIRYADLKLLKSGSDLVLDLDAGDRITLSGWYAGAANQGVGRLQVITTGADYDPASADKSKNKPVEIFDFRKIVQQFDAARGADTASDAGWSAVNSLLNAHLQGSQTQALGGDLSFQYATAGSLAGIGLGAAQGSISSGTDLQTLKTRQQLEQGAVRLA